MEKNSVISDLRKVDIQTFRRKVLKSIIYIYWLASEKYDLQR